MPHDLVARGPSLFVHTEIDATSTYVGGSRALVDVLVRDQLLESFEVNPNDLAM
jgi:hypothetical protein